MGMIVFDKEEAEQAQRESRLFMAFMKATGSECVESYNATPEQYATWAQKTGRMVGQPAPIYANGRLVHQSTD